MASSVGSTRIVVLLIGALSFLAGCGPSEDVSSRPSPPAGPASPDGGTASPPSQGVEFATGRAILEGDDGVTLIDIEVAETSEQQQLGLMHREHLDQDAGMAFIFFEETTGGFWMKNTLIPLSIAFFDAEGEIVRILDMDPCEAEPCETYEPGVPYMGALEVNQGAFERWNIEEGDTIRLLHSERH